MPTIIFDVVLFPDVHLISVNLPDCGFVNREGAETGPQYTFRLSELPVLHQNRPRLSISRIDSVRAALNSYIQLYYLIKLLVSCVCLIHVI